MVVNATLLLMAIAAALALFRRILWPFALLLAATFAAPLSGAPGQRIVAVGDLHGDFLAWTTIARAAGLTDPHDHWTGGNAILVQMGDVTDREPDSLKIIRNLQQLQSEAARKGGKVYVILGNHEAMNLLGDDRYTTNGEYAAFSDNQSEARREKVYEANRAQAEAFYRSGNPKLTPEEIRARWMSEHPLGWVEHRLAWQPSGEIGQWASHNPAVLKIGDILFVHGGISAEYSKVPIEEINRRARAAMAAADDRPNSILTDPLGPLWYRGLAARDAEAEAERARLNNSKAPQNSPLTMDQELATVLASYGVRRIVIAHTPILSGIAISGDERLARIDTGISRYYGGPLTWLEISGGKMVPHSIERPAS